MPGSAHGTVYGFHAIEATLDFVPKVIAHDPKLLRLEYFQSRWRAFAGDAFIRTRG